MDGPLPACTVPHSVSPGLAGRAPQSSCIAAGAQPGAGGLTLDVARAYAETGPDFLAVGGLTHSVSILDIGLDAAE